MIMPRRTSRRQTSIVDEKTPRAIIIYYFLAQNTKQILYGSWSFKLDALMGNGTIDKVSDRQPKSVSKVAQKLLVVKINRATTRNRVVVVAAVLETPGLNQRQAPFRWQKRSSTALPTCSWSMANIQCRNRATSC